MYDLAVLRMRGTHVGHSAGQCRGGASIAMCLDMGHMASYRLARSRLPGVSPLSQATE